MKGDSIMQSFRKVSRGEFSLMETEDKNVFLFFRKDEQPINADWDEIMKTAIQFYTAYEEHYLIVRPTTRKIEMAQSEDKRFVRLTIIPNKTTIKY